MWILHISEIKLPYQSNTAVTYLSNMLVQGPVEEGTYDDVQLLVEGG